MTVTRLISRGVQPIHTNLDGWTAVEGEPTMTTWIEYAAADGSIIAGSWSATVGTFRAEYASFEFVHLIEGVIEITPDGGETTVMRAGDAFCVEASFRGLWTIVEPVHKHFCIRLK